MPGIWALFAGFGITAIISGVAAPAPRTVLLALGATGLIAGALLYLITPQFFVRASLFEQIHGVLASNMGLYYPSAERKSERFYIPCNGTEPGNGAVVIFLPKDVDTVEPANNMSACPSLSEVHEERSGALLYTTGDALLDEYCQILSREVSDVPTELAQQTIDGLKNGLELATTATCDVDRSKQRADIKIEGSIIEPSQRFDDPVTSFVGAVFAYGLDRPVIVEQTGVEEGSISISCRWEEWAWLEEKRSRLRAKSVSSLSEDG